MLLERDIVMVEDELIERSSHADRSCSARAAPMPDYIPLASSRYGAATGPSFTAIALTIAAHVAIAAGLLSLGVSTFSNKEARIVAIDLNSPADEAPPETPPSEPQPQRLETAPMVPVQAFVAPVPAVALAPPALSAPAPAPPTPAAAAPNPPPPPAPPSPPATVNSSDLGTRMISGSPPRYPVQSRRAREQGVVELLLVLGFDGAVESISVSRSSGFDRLDEAALNAVRRWRWEPTLNRGEPVKVRGVVAIPFQLEG